MASKGLTDKRTLTAKERRRQALDLRRSGATYEQIGAQIGVTAQAAHKTVTAALKQLAEEGEQDAAFIRALELERLDRLQLALWRQATAGNHGAVDRIVKLMERRAKLLGLDAPQRIAPTDPAGTGPYSDPAHGISDDERARRIKELLARSQEQPGGDAE